MAEIGGLRVDPTHASVTLRRVVADKLSYHMLRYLRQVHQAFAQKAHGQQTFVQWLVNIYDWNDTTKKKALLQMLDHQRQDITAAQARKEELQQLFDNYYLMTIWYLGQISLINREDIHVQRVDLSMLVHRILSRIATELTMAYNAHLFWERSGWLAGLTAVNPFTEKRGQQMREIIDRGIMNELDAVVDYNKVLGNLYSLMQSATKEPSVDPAIIPHVPEPAALPQMSNGGGGGGGVPMLEGVQGPVARAQFAPREGLAEALKALPHRAEASSKSGRRMNIGPANPSEAASGNLTAPVGQMGHDIKDVPSVKSLPQIGGGEKSEEYSMMSDSDMRSRPVPIHDPDEARNAYPSNIPIDKNIELSEGSSY